MRPNGVIHAHAVKLITFRDAGTDVTEEMYFLPDKPFHELRRYVKSIGDKEVE